jgi:hypothetical protein
MKTLLPLLIACSLGLSGPSWSSDPIDGGPASSISATVYFLTTSTKDKIDFPDASLEEITSFLNRTIELPPGTGVSIDISKIPSPATIRVKLVEKGISLLHAVALLAAQTQSTLLIEPGKIILLPKTKAPTPAPIK